MIYSFTHSFIQPMVSEQLLFARHLLGPSPDCKTLKTGNWFLRSPLTLRPEADTEHVHWNCVSNKLTDMEVTGGGRRGSNTW